MLTTLAPHGFAVGAEVVLTFRGFAPASFDTNALACTALDATTLTYAAPDDPGTVVVCGTVTHEVDLARGYFASSLVFRASANRFEVDP